MQRWRALEGRWITQGGWFTALDLSRIDADIMKTAPKDTELRWHCAHSRYHGEGCL